MRRNIRHGSNTDNSQMAPSLIPIHEVFSAARDDKISSHVADEIVLRARLSRTNDVTGYIGRQYVPLYARNTLFEDNGCTEAGDQTYENMGKDSRYSAQIGRTMQSLEPSKEVKTKIAKKLKYGSSSASSLPSLQSSSSVSGKVSKLKW